VAGERGIALVTGANRGIGREVVRQLAQGGFTAILGARDPDNGEAAAAELRGHGLGVEFRRIDVGRRREREGAGRGLAKDFRRLDVLVNNAAVHYDTWQSGVDADLEVVREALETNLLGAWRTAQACLPLLRRSPHGRLVNVSSGAGSLAGMGAGAPAYSVSKAALNAMTRILAASSERRRAGQRRVPGLGGHGHGQCRRASRRARRCERDAGRDARRRRPDGRILPRRPAARVVTKTQLGVPSPIRTRRHPTGWPAPSGG
jgi:NAD(P)-dependent dehydrogenase (short-subunit alcohol dehydrogenase family)